MAFVRGLLCRECNAPFDEIPVATCDRCLGPLDVAYDWDAIRRHLNRSVIEQGPPSMWRYRALLPVDPTDSIGDRTGWTPLWHARRLGEVLGHPRVFIKYDGANHPTLSFKDRVVATALAWARRQGMTVVGCASTGNLAHSVAAQAARHGFRAVILVPADLEVGKVVATAVHRPTLITVDGHYDHVNRLCYELAEAYGWGMVNINLRAYYGEGSKTVGYEIAEQMGWQVPDHVIVPMAGGSLITKIHRAFQEFIRLGLVEDKPYRMHGAQAEGCGPIVHAFQRGDDVITPERPRTIVRSLAIGNPADGRYALRTIRQTGGQGVAVSDEEVREGIRLLAETEGVFTEPAGGVVVAAAARLIREGSIRPDESVVLAITGHGLKTLEAITDVRPPVYGPIRPNLEAFQALWDRIAGT
jgi:threonine synthase